MRITVVAACLLAACGSKETRRDGPSCDERAQRMADRLGPLAEEPAAMLPVPDGVTPIESARGAAIDRGAPLVVVRRDGGLELDGAPVGGPDELRDRLAEARRRWPELARLDVLPDRDAPAAAIAAVLAARPPELEPRLVVRGPARPVAPYDDALRRAPSVVQFDAAMDRTDPSERAVELARTMETIVARCPPLIELFGAVAGVEDKGRTIARGTAPALRECGCRLTDPDLFEYIMLELLGAFDAPMRWLPLAEVPPDARTAADLAAP